MFPDSSCVAPLTRTGRGDVVDGTGRRVRVTEWTCRVCATVWHETRDDMARVDASRALFVVPD